jgi:hypothetical protein
VHLCTQTENGVSVRTYQTAIHFAKALAYFRGHDAVEVDDLRQIVPWVLHEKLTPNTRSAFFEGAGRQALLLDRVAWIRAMLDQALEAYPRHAPLRARVHEERDRLDAGLAGVDLKTAEQRIAAVTTLMQSLIQSAELSGPVYEDLILLKSMHSRYQNYATWLRSR